MQEVTWLKPIPLVPPASPWQDYHLEEVVHDLNVASAKLAREAADEAMRKDPSRPRFVAGAIGPTNRTASLSPDVNDPSKRNVTLISWSMPITQIKGLVEGGVDILMPETTFDTLNLKAAIFAIGKFLRSIGKSPAGHPFHHHYGCLRTNPFRTNHRSLLEFDCPCKTPWVLG
jgi:hypothetical protein